MTWQLTFGDTASMTVLERSRMRGERANVKAWALGYSRFLGASVGFAIAVLP